MYLWGSTDGNRLALSGPNDEDRRALPMRPNWPRQATSNYRAKLTETDELYLCGPTDRDMLPVTIGPNWRRQASSTYWAQLTETHTVSISLSFTIPSSYFTNLCFICIGAKRGTILVKRLPQNNPDPIPTDPRYRRLIPAGDWLCVVLRAETSHCDQFHFLLCVFSERPVLTVPPCTKSFQVLAFT
jgi:hypothetical protein